MDTTATFLDRLAAKYGGASDYRVAQVLGIARQQVSHYRSGRHTLGDALAVTVAAELGEPAGYVLACLAAERAKAPALRRAWTDAARVIRAAGKAAAASVAAVSVAGLLSVASPGAAQAAHAAPGQISVSRSIHYALFAARRRRGRRDRVRRAPRRRWASW